MSEQSNTEGANLVDTLPHRQGVSASNSSDRKAKSLPPSRVHQSHSPKGKRFDSDERKSLLSKIDRDLTNGITLKEAVKSAGISDQTFYQWRKAEQGGDVKTIKTGFDDFAEFTALEKENLELRALLLEKLRSENAELRRRLGMEYSAGRA